MVLGCSKHETFSWFPIPCLTGLSTLRTETEVLIDAKTPDGLSFNDFVKSKISPNMFVVVLYWQLLFYSILNNSIEKLLCIDLFYNMEIHNRFTEFCKSQLINFSFVLNTFWKLNFYRLHSEKRFSLGSNRFKNVMQFQNESASLCNSLVEI